MKHRRVLESLVAAMLVSSSALAQEAPSALAPAPTPCTGVICLFRSNPPAKPPEPIAQEQAAQGQVGQGQVAQGQAAQGQAPQGQAPQGKGAVLPASDASADVVSDARPAEGVKARPKPVKPTITVAAEAGAMGRLHGLAASLGKEKLRFVTDGRQPADVTVTTTLDPAPGATHARLFTEQMHIVAGSAIVTVADLRDKVVSFGPEKSASQAAARKAFAALGITVKETALDLDNALDGVATGDVAAAIVLAPQPLARLKTLSGLHLVAWPDGGALPEGATVTAIDASAYPGLVKPGESVRAMGVDAVLAVSASGARKPAVKAFLSDIAQHTDALSKRGFDLIKADLESRSGRKVASAGR